MADTSNEVYISIDVESFGPIPGTYSMASFGACVAGEADKTFYRVLKPINSNCDPKTIDIHGITMEDAMKNGADPAVAMREFAEWVERIRGKRRAVLFSFGEFDYAFMKWYLVTYGYPQIGGPNWLDVKSYVMGALDVPWGDTVKRKIPREFFGPRRHTHNALDDALEQGDLFESLMRYNSARTVK